MNVRAAFVDLLNRLTPDQARLDFIERIFRGQWNKRIQAATAESVKYGRELATEQARKQRILDQLADGVLSAEEFGGLNKRTTDRIADLREHLALAESRELDLEAMVEFLIHKVWNTSIEWANGQYHPQIVNSAEDVPRWVDLAGNRLWNTSNAPTLQPLRD